MRGDYRRLWRLSHALSSFSMKTNYNCSRAKCQGSTPGGCDRRIVRSITREVKHHGRTSRIQGMKMLNMLKEIDESVAIIARHRLSLHSLVDGLTNTDFRATGFGGKEAISKFPMRNCSSGAMLLNEPDEVRILKMLRHFPDRTGNRMRKEYRNIRFEFVRQFEHSGARRSESGC